MLFRSIPHLFCNFFFSSMTHFFWSILLVVFDFVSILYFELISSLLISSLSTSLPPWTVPLNLFLCFFEKIYRTIFLCTNLSIIYLFVYHYQDADRFINPSIFSFLSLILCFFPSSLFPSLLPLYLLTSLPSFFPTLT